MPGTPDLKYVVGDTLPPMDFTAHRAKRDGEEIDLTTLVAANLYARAEGDSSVVMAGACVVTQASTGGMRFVISAASVGSTGFSAEGLYMAQVECSWTSGKQTSHVFTIGVGERWRTV